MGTLLPIVIAVIVGVSGVYLRESFRRAVRQKTLASKLEAQLHELFNGILSDGTLSDIWTVGEAWRRESELALREQGVNGFRSVQEKHKELLRDIGTKVSEGLPEVDESIREHRDRYRKMPEGLFKYSVQILESVRESLNSNVGFISEDEAAEISWDTVARVVSVRSSFLRVVRLGVSLLLIQREAEEVDLSVVRMLLYQIVEETIRLCSHLTPLRTKAAAIRNKSVVDLTLENILGKF